MTLSTRVIPLCRRPRYAPTAPRTRPLPHAALPSEHDWWPRAGTVLVEVPGRLRCRGRGEGLTFIRILQRRGSCPGLAAWYSWKKSGAKRKQA